MKLIVLFFVIMSSCSIQAFAQEKKDSVQINTCWNDTIVSLAKKQLGTPYKWGGTNPKGFDCSGLIYFVFKKINFTVPRSSSSYQSIKDTVSLKEVQVGDILVFTGTNPKNRKPGHLGIVTSIEENEIIFIHSSSSKKHSGVVESKLYSTGYKKRYIKTIRVTG